MYSSGTEEKKQVIDEANDNSDPDASNDSIGKYKSLLKNITEEDEAKKEKDVELEFTWGICTKEKVEKLVKERKKNSKELTSFERYLEKRKAKKKGKQQKLKEKIQKRDSEDSMPSDVDINDKYFAEEFKNGKSLSRKKERRNNDNSTDPSNEQEEARRKAELELLLMDQNEVEVKKHFNMKKIEENATMTKSKRKRLGKKNNAQEEAKEDDFEVDVKDSRFVALFTSHHFNIDPTDPHYRKTKGTEALISEKLKRKVNNESLVKDVSRRHFW